MATFSREIIFHTLGQTIQHIKSMQRGEINDLFVKFCESSNVSWDSEKANAFQHAYMSAKLVYEHSKEVSLFYGDIVEWATWDENEINDINKDLYNNNMGVQYALDGISNGLELKSVGSLIFESIVMNNGDFIVNKNNPNNPQQIENLSLDNLTQDLFDKAKDCGIEFLKFISILNIGFPVLPLNPVFAIYLQAQQTSPIPKDPILIDLNGDGIKTTTLENGIFFDHENDGFMETSAWADENDGILAIDKNNNGNIDNGTEIFGDSYVKTDGTVAKDGFDALKDLDSNNDNIINSSDEQFGNIKILKGDGAMLTLEEAGIVSIKLNKTNSNKTDESGNTQLSTSTFIKTDGTTGIVGDYNLQVDKMNSLAVEWLDETEDVSSLPEVMGSGTMHSLHQAILRDESGELKQLFENYLSEQSALNRKNLVASLLYKWAGVENVDSTSRGENVDAKKLAVLEKFMGEDFIGLDKSGNPNDQAGNFLEAAFSKLADNIYATIESQTVLKPLFDMITINFSTENNEYSYNLDKIQEHIDNAIVNNESVGKDILAEFTKVLLNLGLKDYSNYQNFYNHYSSINDEYKFIMDTADKLSIYGTEGDDEIQGTANDEVVQAGAGDDTIYTRQGNDVVYGGDGDDHIDTCEDDDIVYGGKGNDTILGGDGNDILYGEDGDDNITSGNGNDIIYGGDGNDTITSTGGRDYIVGGKGDDNITGYVLPNTYEYSHHLFCHQQQHIPSNPHKYKILIQIL